jgi:hypothetical protein
MTRCSTTPYNARVLQPPNRLPPSSTQRLPEEGEAAKPVPPSKPKAPAALAYTSRPRTQGTAMMPGRMGLATPSYAPLAGSKPLPVRNPSAPNGVFCPSCDSVVQRTTGTASYAGSVQCRRRQ